MFSINFSLISFSVFLSSVDDKHRQSLSFSGQDYFCVTLYLLKNGTTPINSPMPSLLSVLIPHGPTTKNDISELPPLWFLIYHSLNKEIATHLITHLTLGGSEFVPGVAQRGLFPWVWLLYPSLAGKQYTLWITTRTCTSLHPTAPWLSTMSSRESLTALSAKGCCFESLLPWSCGAQATWWRKTH